jgi:hypothetical protein
MRDCPISTNDHEKQRRHKLGKKQNVSMDKHEVKVIQCQSTQGRVNRKSQSTKTGTFFTLKYWNIVTFCYWVKLNRNCVYRVGFLNHSFFIRRVFHPLFFLWMMCFLKSLIKQASSFISSTYCNICHQNIVCHRSFSWQSPIRQGVSENKSHCLLFFPWKYTSILIEKKYRKKTITCTLNMKVS